MLCQSSRLFEHVILPKTDEITRSGKNWKRGWRLYCISAKKINQKFCFWCNFSPKTLFIDSTRKQETKIYNSYFNAKKRDCWEIKEKMSQFSPSLLFNLKQDTWLLNRLKLIALIKINLVQVKIACSPSKIAIYKTLKMAVKMIIMDQKIKLKFDRFKQNVFVFSWIHLVFWHLKILNKFEVIIE